MPTNIQLYKYLRSLTGRLRHPTIRGSRHDSFVKAARPSHRQY